MFLRLLLLFTLLPITELVLLVWLGRKMGLVPTVALVLITGALGATLARWQGMATLRRFQAALGRGELPRGELIEGVLILLAGAVLLTPGLITDTIGFTLLAPPIRRRVANWLGRRIGPPTVIVRGRPPARDPDVIDADFSVQGDDE